MIHDSVLLIGIIPYSDYLRLIIIRLLNMIITYWLSVIVSLSISRQSLLLSSASIIFKRNERNLYDRM